MLLVETKIGSSKIHGIGLFADQFIPKGTPVWEYRDGFDLAIDESEVELLAPPAKRQFLHYDYVSPQTGRHILCFDDARFFNHSDEPNVVCLDGVEEGGVDVAVRDIEKGEEMTIDYSTFDVNFVYKMTKG